MIQIIYPRDPSTEFLLKIYETLVSKFGKEVVNIHYVEADLEAYSASVNFIKSIPEKTHLFFMGHGQDDMLIGGGSIAFKRQPFIERPNFGVFKDKYLVSLSCYSSELLRTSLGHSGIINSIGFGMLPTEMDEVQNNKKLRLQGLHDDILLEFKNILVEIVTNSYSHFLQNELTFGELSHYMILLVNRKISEVILRDKTSTDNRILADLLFHMKNEMNYL